ncbi:MAG: hypothetical protein U9Q78_01885 [Chloroflexota bacterium]|nr:hypothetical protein [Chloroflexota bacterium]
MAEGSRNWPLHGWIGLTLIAIFWPLSWVFPGMRIRLTFFPLWLGYILTMDALVLRRADTSLLRRNGRAFVGLFAISAPAWWIFELINQRTQNWEYLGRGFFTDLEYVLWASLCFSTVIPALFETAELASTFPPLQRLRRGPIIRPTKPVLIGFSIGGAATFALMMLWPRYFFPFIWQSVYFMLAPLNAWLGNRSLSEHTEEGDWRPVAALWVGALICGFFWEMWNYLSFPKWIYHVPFVDFLNIFEMPILGYGGYLPFILELFALYHLVIGLLGGKLDDYVLPSHE